MLLESWVCRLFAFFLFPCSAAQLGNKKPTNKKQTMFDNSGPKLVFFFASWNKWIQKQRRRVSLGRGGPPNGPPLSPGKFFSCLMELNRHNFASVWKLEGKQHVRCPGWRHRSPRFTGAESQSAGKPKSLLFLRAWSKRCVRTCVSGSCWSEAGLSSGLAPSSASGYSKEEKSWRRIAEDANSNTAPESAAASSLVSKRQRRPASRSEFKSVLKPLRYDWENTGRNVPRVRSVKLKSDMILPLQE